MHFQSETNYTQILILDKNITYDNDTSGLYSQKQVIFEQVTKGWSFLHSGVFVLPCCVNLAVKSLTPHLVKPATLVHFLGSVSVTNPIRGRQQKARAVF